MRFSCTRDRGGRYDKEMFAAPTMAFGSVMLGPKGLLQLKHTGRNTRTVQGCNLLAQSPAAHWPDVPAFQCLYSTWFVPV